MSDEFFLKVIYCMYSLTEVRNTIQFIKVDGPDQISNRFLKKLPRKAIVYLTHIMNASFTYSYFPTAWKQAYFVPILKPGEDLSDPKSYRTINLHNALSKILERLLLHLKSQVAEHRKYLNEQFGFHEKHSTAGEQLIKADKTYSGWTSGFRFRPVCCCWTLSLTVCGIMRCFIKSWNTVSL
jgi:hypothetical protein